jgi:hypothetical protein
MKFEMVGNGKVAHLFYSTYYAYCGKGRDFVWSELTPLEGTPVCKSCRRAYEAFHKQSVPEVVP